MSTLKVAFEASRRAGLIERILPAWLAAELYILGRRVPPASQAEPLLGKSPTAGRLSLTVSEHPDAFKGVMDSVPIPANGREILDSFGRCEAFDWIHRRCVRQRDG